jgi:hypothetical protein
MRGQHRLLARPFLVLALVLPALLVLQLAAAERLSTTGEAVDSRYNADLKFLAGEKCEGRGVLTEGLNVAADYIADEFKRLGLKVVAKNPGYFQPFPITSGSKLGEPNKFVLNGPLGQRIELEMGKQFGVVAFGSTGKVDAPLVFVGYGITSADANYNDYKDIDVAGKVVVVLRRAPRYGNDEATPFTGGTENHHSSLLGKASNAFVHKAAAVVFVNDNAEALQTRDRLIQFAETSQSRIPVDLPVFHLKRSYVNHMVQSVTGNDLSTIEKGIDRDMKPRTFALDGWSCNLMTFVERQTRDIKNVIGVLEGKGPLANETVVIGAHYDHLGRGERGSRTPNNKAIHFGADDNASGTVMVMEMARRFAEMPDRQGRRLVFMLFSGEESGLLGSAHYCRNPIFPLKDTVAMVNMDMVGRLRDNKLTIYGLGTAKTFEALIDELNKKHKFEVVKVKSGFGPSDHSSFYARQIPVFHFFTGLHEQYHKPSDTPDTINVEGMRRITDMVMELTQTLATDAKRPEYLYTPPQRQGGPPGPRLGVVPNYTDEKEGVLIDGVTPNLPAAKAGLKAGDRIVEIGGKPTPNMTAYMSVMAGYRRGDKFDVTVLRDGKKETLKVALE